ncbi:unnamed protein product [Spirodela intermedia]|uniref:Uncharacterized protein n=1 Tax=Spirodela intermedia TaxID=51605 RepID=A0A7I8JSV2_SPIIN|nr:unnamed protein product [Spirodela intermedia]CAA6672502.1 unnamed protein product [Spirodela intermedia]
MGNQDVWEDQHHSLLNGLLSNEVASVTRVLDADRWSLAEARTGELIKCIQPNPHSEDRRNAVVNYVQRLIAKCISCQVFTFGSVPLKTYLPDGDIDMSAFSNNLNLKDTWASEVRDMLENEEKSENAEFRVKEVQYIQAEVKIIKCLVENIVVDISFNQLGGLCTLCFLEEIDQFISHDHLFKRSIILIKAWCYYESRILGAHHGLISTYALEILVLYIFHVFNNSFTGPLEVLYRFLEFFSNFDWDNFCVSLWGPVPVSSLPDVSAEPPRKDTGELLLNEQFLDNCSSRYSPFVSKFFNVIDPLRTNNNLGRSVSKGNFFRIRSAFAFGAKRLAGLLECPKDDIISEVNMFFMNTWKRHGSGHRPDAPGSYLWNMQPSDSPGPVDESKNSHNHSELRMSENLGSMVGHEYQNDAGISLRNLPSGCFYCNISITKSKNLWQSNSLQNFRSNRRNVRSNEPVQGAKVQKSPRPNYVSISRTRSSPELSDTSSVGSSRRQTKIPETVKSHITSSRPEHAGRMKNLGSEIPTSHYSRFSVNDSSSLRHSSSNQSLDVATDSTAVQIVITVMLVLLHQVMICLLPCHSHYPFSACINGRSSKKSSRNSPGNIPLINPHGGSIMQFPHGLPSSQLPRYFHNAGLVSNPEEITDSGHESSSLREVTVEDDNGFWPEQESVSRGSTPDRRNFQRFHSDDRHSSSMGVNSSSLGADNSSDSFNRGQHSFVRENRLARVEPSDSFQHQNDRGQETYSTDTATNSRFMANAQASSSRSSSFSELARDKRGRKPAPVLSSASYVVSKRGLQYDESSSVNVSVPGEDEHKDWIPLAAERSMVPSSLAPGLSHSHQLSGFEPKQLAKDRDNAGVIFYPMGPPVPFLTRFPIWNFPSESGNFDGSVSLDDNGLDNGHLNPPDKNFDMGRNLEHLEARLSPSSAKGASFEHLEEHNRDILNSDFLSHLQNLQYGRFCQDTHYPGQFMYPSPMVFPTVYLQGHFPWDSPGRPLPNNVNLFPFTGYGPRLVPQPGVFQRYGDEVPRYRGGTGTYLPTPKASSYRDRQSSRGRNHKGNYNYERSDHADREGSWTSSKSRAANRSHGRNQAEKSNPRPDRSSVPDNRSNRPWDSHRNEPTPSYQNQNSSFTASSKQVSANVPHGMHHWVCVPSVVMLYPYEPSHSDYESSQQLEFGSQRPVHLRAMRPVFDQRQGAYDQQASPHSSPEQPSSPQVHRRGI